MSDAITHSRHQVLKRVYTCITLGLEELASISSCFERRGCIATMRANTFRLWHIDELRDVVAQEEVVDRLSFSVYSSPEGELRLVHELGYVLLEATDEIWRSAFERVRAILDALPHNGTRHCLIAVRPRDASPVAVHP